MLTFGWAFSFLDRFVEAQGGLRASRDELGIFGTPGGSTAALRARNDGKLTNYCQTAKYGQRTRSVPRPRAEPRPLSLSFQSFPIGSPGAVTTSE